MRPKIETQNVLALIRQKHQPLLEIIEAYEAGGNIEVLTAEWRGYGTTGEAIAEYVMANHKQTKKRKLTPKKVGE